MISLERFLVQKIRNIRKSSITQLRKTKQRKQKKPLLEKTPPAPPPRRRAVTLAWTLTLGGLGVLGQGHTALPRDDAPGHGSAPHVASGRFEAGHQKLDSDTSRPLPTPDTDRSTRGFQLFISGHQEGPEAQGASPLPPPAWPRHLSLVSASTLSTHSALSPATQRQPGVFVLRSKLSRDFPVTRSDSQALRVTDMPVTRLRCLFLGQALHNHATAP